MKISPKEVADLLVLINHARTDITYGEEGTYNIEGKYGYEVDKKSVEMANRGIEFIKKLILERDSSINK